MAVALSAIGLSLGMSLSANLAYPGNQSNNLKRENPSLRWAGVDGRSVNRLFAYMHFVT